MLVLTELLKLVQKEEKNENAKTYACEYTIDGQRYTYTVLSQSPMEVKRIVNGNLANICKKIYTFNVRKLDENNILKEGEK